MKLTVNEIEKRLVNLNGWTLNGDFIGKEFTFKDFKQAMSAMMEIAFEAESLNHHPNWSNVYNRLNIQLSTHDASGITEKDFKLAEKIEAIVNQCI